MKFAYEDLSDDQFEQLVVFLCQKLLGIAVQGFAKGPDGGRDARFVGTAELHPSKSSPWKGTVIIQAKHTNRYNLGFSESDFYSLEGENTVLSKEIPRIKNLKDNSQLDYYMLFANRRLAGNANDDILDYISKNSGVDKSSIYLCGVEQIETWLKVFPDVPRMANLDPVDSPLIVSPDDLAEVVAALARETTAFQIVSDDPPVPRITYENKNEVNNMTRAYAKALRNRYLKDTAQIKNFLSAPENTDILRLYESVVDEFQLKIIAKRKGYQTFDEVMNYLVDLLFGRDPILRQNKRLTRLMIFYMYWNCDIGEEDNVTTN